MLANRLRTRPINPRLNLFFNLMASLLTAKIDLQTFLKNITANHVTYILLFTKRILIISYPLSNDLLSAIELLSLNVYISMEEPITTVKQLPLHDLQGQMACLIHIINIFSPCWPLIQL